MARRPEQQHAHRRATPDVPASEAEHTSVDAQAMLGNSAMQGLLHGRADSRVDPTGLGEGLHRSGTEPPFLRAVTASGDLSFARAYLDAVRIRRAQGPVGMNREEDEDEDGGCTPE